MSVQLHTDPLKVLSAECEKHVQLATATAEWVEEQATGLVSTTRDHTRSDRKICAGDGPTFETSVFSMHSVTQEQQLAMSSMLSQAGQGLLPHSPPDPAHGLASDWLSPTGPDELSLADRTKCYGVSAPDISCPPPSMSPPQPTRTHSPPLLPGATAAAEISRPESPCNSKGATASTGVVRGRITIPPSILASQMSCDNSPRIMARGRSLPINRKQHDRPFHNVPLKKKDLSTGEVVRFSYRAQPYLVQPDPHDENCFFLSLGRPDQDGSALEVLRDEASGWLGFRSASADDRFLQASKRRVAKLMLFNHNFGTNEHWEMLNPPQLPWTRTPCQFRHRRYQECVLSVDVERIGHFDPVPSGTLTPRSFQPAPMKHDQLSRLLTTLSKVSGGIDRETESNAQLRAKTLELEKQLRDAKKDSQQMVAALQQTMSEQVMVLRDELTSAQLHCNRMMSWGVRVIGSRHTSILLREAWAAWKEVTWHGLDWQARELKIQLLVARLARFRTHKVINAWWEAVNQAMHARLLAERAYKRLMHQQLAESFGAWQATVAVAAHAREALARATIRQWVACVHESRKRVQACERMAAISKQRQLACVFRLWHQMLLDTQAAIGQMRKRMQWKRLAVSFAAWCAVANGSSALRAGAIGTGGVSVTVRTSRQRCRLAFRTWRQHAARKARNREVVVRRLHVIARRLQSSVLLEWHSATLRRRRGRRIVQRCSLQRQKQCMRAVLDAWRGVGNFAPDFLENLKQGLSRRFTGRIQSQVFYSWKASVLDSRNRKVKMMGLLELMNRRYLSQAFSGFAHAVSNRKHAEHRLSTVMRQHVLRRTLATWRFWAVCEREMQAVLLRAALRIRNLKLTQAFCTWWEWCDEARAARGKMKKVLQRVRSINLAIAFSKWRSETTWALHLHRMELQAAVHWERAICRRAMREWVVLVREKKRVHLNVFMRTAAVRIQHAELACAFEDWRANVQELRRQQRLLARALARMQRQTMAASFQHFRGVVRWRQRGKRIVAACHARRCRRILVAAFEGFKQAVHNQRHLSSTLQSVAARARSSNAAAAFAAWAEAAELRRSQEAAADAHHHLRLLSHTWNVWTECVAIQLLDREHKLSGFLASRLPVRATSLKNDVFSAWRHSAACGGITDTQQRLMNQHVSRMERKLVRTALVAWRQATDARYERMRRLLILRSKLLKASALRSWHCNAMECVRQRRLLTRAGARIQRARLRNTFTVWAEVTLACAHSRARAEKLHRLALAHILAKSFRAWQMLTARCRCSNLASCMLLTKSRQLHLSRAFHTWRQNAEQQRMQQQKCSWIRARRAKRTLSDTWVSWRSIVSCKRRHRALVQRMHTRIQHATLRRAFDAWAASACSGPQSHETAVWILSRAFHTSTRAVFAAWRALAAGGAHTRKCVHVCMQSTHAQCISYAFYAWVAAVENKHAANHAAERRAAKLRLGSLLSAFAGWRQEISTRHCLIERANRALQNSMRRRLHSAFLEWRAVTLERLCHSASVRRFRERWTKSVVASCFNRWCAAATELKQQRFRWQQMERKSMHDLKAQCFYAWCLVRQERLDGKEAVRRCVAGKRIAFQAFQKWFGNNLEEPVCSILHKLFLDGDDFDSSELQELSYNSPTCQPSVGNLDVEVTQRLLEQSTAQSIAFQGRLFLSCSRSGSPDRNLPSPTQDAAALLPMTHSPNLN